MSAGLVAYKLCDRGFDCEHCPFDRALRGGGPAATEEDGGRATAPAPGRFPADRRYHVSHTWVAAAAGGRARIGLDAFAARLMGPPAAVIAPPAGAPLRRGEVACWLTADDRPIPVRSPLSGTVVRRNPRLAAEPGLVAAAPYDEGWLLEVEPAAAGDEEGGLLAAEPARLRAERHHAELLAEAAEVAGAAVGPTLADGGEPLADLRAVLGVERHRRLLLRYLG